MFKLAIRMFVSDFKEMVSSFRLIVLFILSMLFLTVIPLIEMESFSLMTMYGMYVIMFATAWFIPYPGRVFFVVPLTIGQIKRLAIYRIILILACILIGNVIVIGVAEGFDYSWNPGFGLWHFFYAEIGGVFTVCNLSGFLPKRKTSISWMITYVTICMMVMVITFGLLDDVLPLYVEYLIQIALFVFCVILGIFHVFRKMDFYDYKYEEYGWFGNWLRPAEKAKIS